MRTTGRTTTRTGSARAAAPTRGRRALAAGVCAVVLAATALAAPAPPASAATDVLGEQVAVVSAGYQPAVDAASAALGAAQTGLGAAQARQRADQALVDQAAAAVTAAIAAVGTDSAALATDTAARDAAAAGVATDLTHLRAIGVELYVGPQVLAVPARGGDALAQAQAQEFATQVITIGTGVLRDDLHHHQADQRRAAGAAAADTHRLGDDRATLARATALRADRTVILARDQAAVTAAAGSVQADQVTLVATQAALQRAVAAVANPPGTLPDGSPSIVGQAALDQAQLVGWYRSEGWSDLTPAPITDLAGWYLSEGAAEGVRGDIAFAQAMVETAGFSSNDAVTLNNYAGIGHCDSCGSGLAFGSPQLGVRGQVQLLHSFADGSLTTAGLARPLAAAILTPQTQPDRGCCTTWQSLTGKWASDPLYGHTIMSVYQRMLAYALAARPA